MINKWCIIINPRAGNSAVGKRWPALKALLQQHLVDIDVQFTKAPQHGMILAEEAIRKGYRRILAVGGDGTNHEVINGIIRQQICPSTEVIYGLIPIGTGNDWRRAYRIPRNMESWVSQIAQGKTVLQDIGKMTYHVESQQQSRYFTNVAGLAYDAFVVRYLRDNPSLVTNKFLYLFAIFSCLQQYELQKVRIEFENKCIEKYCYTINAGICPYSGGGMRIVPHARPDDGLLALTIAGAISKLGVLFNTHRFYNGHLDKHPKVDLFQAQLIKVTSLSDQPIPVEADGEFLGYTPAVIEILPKILQVIVPANYQKYP